MKLEEQQAQDKLKNSNLRNLEKTSRDLEININRLDVKLDSMLETLNSEYEMTFERAKNEYVLDIEPEEARSKVNHYRSNIKRIGMVNLDAIEEYNRVKGRYDFLTKQREDLKNAGAIFAPAFFDWNVYNSKRMYKNSYCNNWNISNWFEMFWNVEICR